MEQENLFIKYEPDEFKIVIDEDEEEDDDDLLVEIKETIEEGLSFVAENLNQ